MAAGTVHLQVTGGPGKWELLESFVSILNPDLHTSVSFTFKGKHARSGHGKITGVRRAKHEFSTSPDDVLIEGFLTNGVSPYEHHGTPFTGRYNPTNRSGSLTIKEV